MNKLDALIDWAHANRLSFHITENNVWLRNDKKDYHAQAQTFEAMLRLLLKKRNGGVVTWNVWNLSDRDSWKKRGNWRDASLTEIIGLNLPTMLYKKYWKTLLKRINA